MEDRDLRRYIRSILTEMDFGGIGDGGGYGSYGVNYGAGMYGGIGGWGGDSVLKVFGNPILDVGKTAVGVGKEVGVAAKGIARTGVEAMLSLVLPFVSGEYEKISKETHEELSKVKKEYQEVYKRNLDAFFNTDLVTLAFMANPAAVLTGLAFDKILYRSPDAALSVLGWFVPLSGRKSWESLMRKLDPERLQRILRTAAGEDKKTKLIVWDDKNRRKLYSNVRRAMGIEHDPSDPDSSPIEASRKGGLHINEEVEGGGTTFQDVVKGMFRDPAIHDAMTKGEQAQRLRELARKLVSRRLAAIVHIAMQVTEAPTMDALGKVTGQQLKGDEKELEKIKADVKERLVKSLQTEIESLSSSGVDPAASGMQKPYDEAIKQINHLSVNKASQYGTVSPRGETNGKEQQQQGSGDGGPGTAGRAQSTQGSDRGVHQKAPAH